MRRAYEDETNTHWYFDDENNSGEFSCDTLPEANGNFNDSLSKEPASQGDKSDHGSKSKDQLENERQKHSLSASPILANSYPSTQNLLHVSTPALQFTGYLPGAIRGNPYYQTFLLQQPLLSTPNNSPILATFKLVWIKQDKNEIQSVWNMQLRSILKELTQQDHENLLSFLILNINFSENKYCIDELRGLMKSPSESFMEKILKELLNTIHDRDLLEKLNNLDCKNRLQLPKNIGLRLLLIRSLYLKGFFNRSIGVCLYVVNYDYYRLRCTNKDNYKNFQMSIQERINQLSTHSKAVSGKSQSTYSSLSPVLNGQNKRPAEQSLEAPPCVADTDTQSNLSILKDNQYDVPAPLEYPELENDNYDFTL